MRQPHGDGQWHERQSYLRDRCANMLRTYARFNPRRQYHWQRNGDHATEHNQGDGHNVGANPLATLLHHDKHGLGHGHGICECAHRNDGQQHNEIHALGENSNTGAPTVLGNISERHAREQPNVVMRTRGDAVKTKCAIQITYFFRHKQASSATRRGGVSAQAILRLAIGAHGS